VNGCVFKRKLPSGTVTWGYSIEIGRDQNGKRKQLFKSGFAKKKEAEDALRIRLNEKEAGELVKPDPTLFSAFMEEVCQEDAKSVMLFERWRWALRNRPVGGGFKLP
jgi:hypothetical protein